jgi:hypothetical protein
LASKFLEECYVADDLDAMHSTVTVHIIWFKRCVTGAQHSGFAGDCRLQD